MSATEHSGRTVDEAIERALAALGVSRDQVEVEVIQEPRAALLGLGGREAKVRVTRQATPGEFAGREAEQILRLMGYEGQATVEESATGDGISLTLTGQEIASLVGRDGRALDALEFLLGLHVARRQGQWIQIVVDAAGYRARREKALTETALQAAERAVREGTPVFLDPMESRDRRTVHMILQDDPRVRTASEGEADQRRVGVHPKEHTPPTE